MRGTAHGMRARGSALGAENWPQAPYSSAHLHLDTEQCDAESPAGRWER